MLACAVLSLTAISALDATGASALGKQCSGGEIVGEGAHLQETAQSAWTGSKETGFNGSGAASACNGSQGSGGKPKVQFNGFSSGGALAEWGAEDGKLHIENRAFIATDEPPAGPVGEAGTQLANMKAALISDLVVAPATQTAIAIVANPPQLPAHSACVVGQVSQSDLEAVFSGQLTNWRQLSTASDQAAGGDCDQAITRVVRNDLSGVTYQFKHYLDQLNPEALPCTGKSQKSWAQLQSSREPEKLNLVWPRKSDCQEGEGPVTVVTAPKGTETWVGYVAEHRGTITYAELPKAKQLASEYIVKVGNGVNMVRPDLESEANCAATKYSLPSGWESGLNADWSQVYGANPEIGKEVGENAYPICTLTWNITAAKAGSVFGNEAGTTVRDYLRYLNDSKGGQQDVLGHWYSPLPGNVSEATAVALEQIGAGGGGSASGTVLCKASPKSSEGVLRCPEGEGFTGIEVTGELLPETEATFGSTAGPELSVSCPQGEYQGEFAKDGSSASGGIVNFVFGNKTGCTTTFPESPEAVVRFANPALNASKFVYLSPLAPHGALVLAKKSGQIELRIESSIECTYVPTFLGGQVVNGSPTTLTVQGLWQWIEGPEEACPKTLQQSSQLAITQGGGGEGAPLYVAGE
ncbi:MAG TPA: substrate-binding domain-containing protein [Solirubrobacterales bacterium]|nr:substrate-binding domain-containing protein [Solirubrobacterales bacterium]